MEYKKKLQKRLLWNLIWGVIGLTLVVIWNFSNKENQFLFSFGIAMMVIAVVRTIQYRKTTKDDKALRQKELAETDERFLMMSERAKGWAFSLYLTITGFAVIIGSVLGYQDEVLPLAWNICAMVALYWLCWLVIRKKY